MGNVYSFEGFLFTCKATCQNISHAPHASASSDKFCGCTVTLMPTQIFFKLLGAEHWQGIPRGKNKIKQYECALVLMHSLPRECNYNL